MTGELLGALATGSVIGALSAGLLVAAVADLMPTWRHTAPAEPLPYAEQPTDLLPRLHHLDDARRAHGAHRKEHTR